MTPLCLPRTHALQLTCHAAACATLVQQSRSVVQLPIMTARSRRATPSCVVCRVSCHCVVCRVSCVMTMSLCRVSCVVCHDIVSCVMILCRVSCVTCRVACAGQVPRVADERGPDGALLLLLCVLHAHRLHRLRARSALCCTMSYPPTCTVRPLLHRTRLRQASPLPLPVQLRPLSPIPLKSSSFPNFNHIKVKEFIIS